jgi:hypothetical protein
VAIARTPKEDDLCKRLGVAAERPTAGSKLGIALSTLGQQPVNGLRHRATETTCGWYIWCGQELSPAYDFFMPLHAEHVQEHLPEVLPYLALPPGYRFQIDGDGWEDVWYDETLLQADA